MGMIGQAFAREASNHPAFELRAVCHLSGGHGVATREQPVRQYDSLADFAADPAIQAVIIATPHWMHAPNASACLRAGKHVLLEKPIATSTAQLMDLLAVAHTSQAIVCALPHTQYPYLETAESILSNGCIGEIVAFESVLDVPGPPRGNWYYTSQAVGGASMDTMPYALGRLLSLTGGDIEKTIGSLTRTLPKRLTGDGSRVDSEVDDAATMVLTYQSGQEAIVRSNWCVSRADDHLLIRGRQGDLWIDCWSGIAIVTGVTAPAVPYTEGTWMGHPAYTIQGPTGNPERLKLNVFASMVRGERSSNLAEGAYGLSLILQLVEGGQMPIVSSLPYPSAGRLPG